MEHIENFEAANPEIEKAVKLLLENNDLDQVVEILKNNKDDVGEFCLQIRDQFPDDPSAAILHLAQVIEKLL